MTKVFHTWGIYLGMCVLELQVVAQHSVSSAIMLLAVQDSKRSLTCCCSNLL